MTPVACTIASSEFPSVSRVVSAPDVCMYDIYHIERMNITWMELVQYVQ